MTGMFVVLPPVRRAIARVTPVKADNAVHATALLLAVYLVGNTLSTLGQGGLEALADTIGSANIWQVVGQQLLFVVVGIAGIGIFIRRTSPTEIAQRLGLEIPTLRQLAIGLGIAILLVIAQFIVGAIALVVTPDTIAAIEDINVVLLGEMDSLGEWFVLAVSAGVGEEILFRGALQPILGIPLTAMLFTIAHVQYGITIITAYFIILAVVLSVVRQKMNTTTAIFIHFAYDFILGLFALLVPILEKMVPELGAILLLMQ
jgi:membrane protease YdiL (CAAX protease family)